MIKRLIKGFSWAKRLEDEQGAALVELALCLFILLVLVFGIIDFSQVIFDHQQMCGLARQGSNLALRSKLPLKQVVQALEVQGAPMNIGTQGRIIVTAVSNDSNGNPVILDQYMATTGINVTSAIGTGQPGQNDPATMPASATPLLNSNQVIYVTEVFYSYSPLTPVGHFLRTSLSSTLYESAYF